MTSIPRSPRSAQLVGKHLAAVDEVTINGGVTAFGHPSIAGVRNNDRVIVGSAGSTQSAAPSAASGAGHTGAVP